MGKTRLQNYTAQLGVHSVLWHSREITLWSQAHHAGPHTHGTLHVGIDFVVWGLVVRHGPHLARQVLCPIPAVDTFPTLMALRFVSYFLQGVWAILP